MNGNGTVDIQYDDGEFVQHETDPSMRKRRGRSKIRNSADSSCTSIGSNIIAGIAKRPRGRNPKGLKWDYKIGKWIKDSKQSKVHKIQIVAAASEPYINATLLRVLQVETTATETNSLPSLATASCSRMVCHFCLWPFSNPTFC